MQTITRNTIITALALMAQVALFGQQASGPHHIDFTQAIKDLDGKPISNGDAKAPHDLNLGDVCVAALNASSDEDRTMSGEDKFKLYEISLRIFKKKDAVLSPEDVALLKKRIAKLWGPGVVGPAWKMLDPTLDKKE